MYWFIRSSKLGGECPSCVEESKREAEPTSFVQGRVEYTASSTIGGQAHRQAFHLAAEDNVMFQDKIFRASQRLSNRLMIAASFSFFFSFSNIFLLWYYCIINVLLFYRAGLKREFGVVRGYIGVKIFCVELEEGKQVVLVGEARAAWFKG